MADEKGSKWQCYIIPDLATWTGAAGSKPYTPIEFYDTYEQAAARFKELLQQPYNSEEVPGAPTCSMCARAKTTWWTIIPGCLL